MRIVCLRSVRNLVERMTIDEVITKYKEITNTAANCPMYCMRNCDKCVQESRQIAEWLEKLKKYEEKPEGYLWDEAVQQGYSKAIDDFQEWLKTQIVGLDNKTKEILVVIDDRWELATDKFKEGMNNA